jgi:acyl-CoA dehydrogenase
MQQLHDMLVNQPLPATIVVILAIVMIIGYFGAPLWLWMIVVAGALHGLGAPDLLVYLVVAVMLLFVIVPIRRVLVTKPLMSLLDKLGILPTISDTERIAIDAGTVWVDSEYFSGKPDFNRILNQPYTRLTEEEQAFLDGPIEELCAATHDWEVHCNRDLPPEVWALMKKHRLFGMIIPKEYGGLEFSPLANSAVVTKLSSRSMPLAITAMVPNSLGPAELLLHYGTEEQKKYYLPRLADGREIPCFALTEPTAGSDAGAMSARGVIFRDDDGQIKIRLNWRKRYITLAAVSTVMGLAFKLDDPDNLLGKGTKLGITCALIPSDTPGVKLGRRHDPLGTPFYNCPINGEDVVVGVDCIIGGADGAGNGWAMLMDCLSAGRALSLPAVSTGCAKLVTRTVGAYAAVRRQFGIPIGMFEGIEEPLAEIGGLTYMLEAARIYTASGVQAGEKPSVISAIAKYQFTEISRQLINHGMDIMGGAAISRGPRNLLANPYTSTPISITVEGANILTRTMIVFGQGMIRCHPYAQGEVTALEAKDVVTFDRLFFGHIGFSVRNGFRAAVLTATRGCLVPAPVGGPTAHYYRKLTWASAVFAVLTDMAMGMYGGTLKRKEKITGRLADMLSWMYLASCVLKRYEAENRQAEHLDYVRWNLDYAMREIQIALEGILKNIDLPVVGVILGGPIHWLFRANPIGVGPSDRLGHKVAKPIQKAGPMRDALTENIYIPEAPPEALGRLETALKLVGEATEIEAKIKAAVKRGDLEKARVPLLVGAAREKGIISEEEAATLERAMAAALDAIQVDAYPLDSYADSLQPEVVE